MKKNDVAPDFTLKDASMNDVSLHDFHGRWVILYFYPKDNTPGCTIEAIAFTKLAPEFERLGAHILGVSRDSCESHMKFEKERKLGITLLSDPDASVQKLYGTWGEKKFMGRKITGTIRTTFLVNPDGGIAKVWNDVNPLGHADIVLKELRKIVGK